MIELRKSGVLFEIIDLGNPQGRLVLTYHEMAELADAMKKAGF